LDAICNQLATAPGHREIKSLHSCFQEEVSSYTQRCARGSLIVCLREYLMLQFIGEKEKEKKEEILVIAFGDSFPLIPQFS